MKSHQHVVPNERASKRNGTGTSSLMGMVYTADIDFWEEYPIDQMTKWLDLQAHEVRETIWETIEENRSIQSSHSFISEFFNSKTDLVRTLLETDSNSEIAAEPINDINDIVNVVHSQDEADGVTLIEIDPKEEIQQIELEVMNTVFPDYVIDDMKGILEEVST